MSHVLSKYKARPGVYSPLTSKADHAVVISDCVTTPLNCQQFTPPTVVEVTGITQPLETIKPDNTDAAKVL
jgi:hypothetical protein